jgi:hypothetical protein
VTLNGQGYVLDLDRYVKRIREPFVARQSQQHQGSIEVGDLRGPEQVLVISDWSGGEGAVQHEQAIGSGQAGQYRTGVAVDGYSQPGALRLGPQSQAVSAGALNHFGLMKSYAGKLYVSANNVSGVPNIFVWDGATIPSSLVCAAGRFPASMEVFLNRLYVGNSGDGTVAYFDGTTWTAVKFTLAAGVARAMATHYRQAAQYLYIAAAGGGVNGACRLVYWDGSSLSLGQFDLEEPACDVMVTWRQRLWIFSADSTRRLGAIYSVDDGGSGGTWRTHRKLEGSSFTAGCTFGDAAYVGCALDGEIYRWDGDDLTLMLRLATRDAGYGASILGMAAWAGALWVAIQDGAGGTGLLRYDGASWSRPVRSILGSTPGYLAEYAGALHYTTSQTSAATFGRAAALSFAGSGVLESGLINCGLPGVAKLMKSVTIVTSAVAASQSIQVEYRLEDTGGWTSLGTLNALNATTATYAFAANTTGRQIAFRLTLSGPGASSPVLYELSLRYVPRPALAREWELAVALDGTPELPLVTLDGTGEPLTGAQLTQLLWTAAGVAGPVTLVDLDGTSYPVYVQDVREEIGKISQRRGYQRLGLVKLVEAA